MTKKRRSGNAAAPKKPSVPAWEKEQVRARKKAGLTHAIRIDEYGRERLSGRDIGTKKQPKWLGTAESTRQFEVRSGGKIYVRNVDPLKGITSLTHHQREAGKKYREVYEAAASIGIKSGSFNERVDGGGQMKDIPPQLLRTLEVYAKANEKIGHHEIESVVRAICGDCLSIQEYIDRERDDRKSVLRLLKIGLDKLAIFFGMVPDPKNAKPKNRVLT